eukprot:gene612-3922_t
MLAAVIEDRRLVWSNDPDKNLARCSEIKADYVSADKILIPQISSLSPITTALPLVFVLGVTAIKDGNDDYKRHKSDSTVNNRKIEILRTGHWETSTWQEVTVGDIVRIVKDKFVPADVIILATSETDNDCYIETADLDGETNLKKRYACEATRELTEAQLSSMKCEVTCNAPNSKLDEFDGTITVNGEKAAAVGNKNVILR